ncbi:MAG: selenocysteine-specific elongation factor [Frankiaceae bacterium]|jgi:selenocysteine-specific elongation factor|nr:selenocysteine-specific elongation factor [Frankiaceae bacterium]
MHVVATAGHVDHGKSALVRALTGMEPDRWAEERRRGMTIDLGFAWTTLPSGTALSFVDVPGHERFVTNMLAGVGPVPAVCLVVAADEGWRPQTDEHVRALDALGVRRGLLVVTKTDLADPAPVIDDVRRRLGTTSLRDIGAVGVSAVTGDGLRALRAALDDLVAGLSLDPAEDAPVRFWVDRAFTVQGAGTVVTGTLPAGSIRTGDTLSLVGMEVRDVVVRGLHAHGDARDRVGAVDRVAVNLRGVARSDVARGMSLVTPGAWCVTAEVDVRVDAQVSGDWVAHLGSAAVPVRPRPLAGDVVRLRLAQPLPLHAGDRLLLREPASRRVAGATVLDVAPRPLRRRGDAARVAATLTWPRTTAEEVARLCKVRRTDLVAAGFDVPGSDDGYLYAPGHAARQPVAPVAVAAEPSPPLRDFLGRLDAEPFAGLGGEGVDPAELSAAVRAGRVLRLGRGLYLAADAPDRAVAILAGLPQPFTVSAAGQALGSTRRVVVPVLEHLDATRRTRRDRDGNREVTRPGA